MTDTCSERLFSYGTLRDEAVQRANFGRTLKGTPDTVTGYKLSSVQITDLEVIAESGLGVHRILVPSDDPANTVEGVVFSITEHELRGADEYETDAYKRVCVKLKSSLDAWVYVSVKHG